jgi:cobalamin synthase
MWVLCLERYVRRKLGGVVGDCLGLACYTAQVLVLLAACAGR